MAVLIVLGIVGLAMLAIDWRYNVMPGQKR